MNQVSFDKPQNIKLHHLAPNHGFCVTACKVVAAVVVAIANLFRTISLSFVINKAAWLKDEGISLFPERIAMEWDPRRLFVRTILDVAPDQRAAVLQSALPDISPQMDPARRDQLIRLVSNQNSDSRLSRSMLQFVTPDMYSFDSIRRVVVISVKDIIPHADEFITLEMSGRSSSIREISQEVARIPAPEREAVLGNALSLITPEMTFRERISMLQEVARIPPSEREAVLGNALSLITPEMTFRERISRLQAVAGIPASEREAVLGNALSLITPQMTSYERISILQKVAGIPASEREAVLGNALSLITPQMTSYERISILQKVARIPAPEREEVIRNIVSLITLQMTSYERIVILQEVANIPAPEREEVIRNALLLITPEMNFNQVNAMIQKVIDIPTNQRDNVIDLALQASRALHGILPMMFAYTRRTIVLAILIIPVQERVDVIALALQVIKPQMGAAHVALIIWELVNLPADQRVDYVQQHIDWQQADWAEVVRLWELQRRRVDWNPDRRRGINVHADDRDLRLREGIQLLRKHQGNIPEDRINLEVEAFTQYLNNCQMNAEHKRLAQHALSAPKGENDSFGPLISATDFSVLGLQISGQELVARLWIFASKLAEPDQTSAKTSMISALKDSYEMGSRVCNQGKTQRLIVGVLQGRFEGVNIELKPDMELPIPKALEMFFNIPAHREIEQLRPLLDAANRFCDENPLVKNRALFVQEMKEYAKQQFPPPQSMVKRLVLVLEGVMSFILRFPSFSLLK